MPTDFVRTKWNLIVLKALNKARKDGDIVTITYWKGMFV
jgi:hypothetical protein